MKTMNGIHIIGVDHGYANIKTAKRRLIGWWNLCRERSDVRPQAPYKRATAQRAALSESYSQSLSSTQKRPPKGDAP